jgi:regulator of ribonuclease activity A
MFTLADLMDAEPTRRASCLLQFRDFGRRVTFSGPIRTVRCFEDTALLKSVLAEPGEGAVLVVDGHGSPRTALLGDRVAALAAANRWAGLVLHGMVRDVAALAAVDLGIKALGSNPRKPGQTGAGDVDEPVTFGGVTFVPGAQLWSDADGVVVETNNAPEPRGA